MNKEQRYTLAIYEAMASIFDEENENFKFKLNNVDLTAFFTAYVMAFGVLYENVTGKSNGDHLESIAMMNRLIFQYLQGGRENA